MNDVKRIIIVACGAVLAVMLVFFIKNHMDTDGWKTAYKYHIAITANKDDQFNYDVDSHQGLVLSHGDFSTKQGAKFDEMNKDFTYVEKVHEHYTMHTQTYSCGTSKAPRTCIRTYWTWDYTGSDEKFADKTSYFNREYNTSTFGYHNLVTKLDACSVTSANKNTGFFSSKHGCSKDWGGAEYFYEDNDDRYYYNAVPLKFSASFLTDTSKGTLINPFGGRVSLETKSTDQMVKESTSYQFWDNVFMVIGGIVVLIAMIIVGYNWVMADGKWSLDE